MGQQQPAFSDKPRHAALPNICWTIASLEEPDGREHLTYIPTGWYAMRLGVPVNPESLA